MNKTEMIKTLTSIVEGKPATRKACKEAVAMAANLNPNLLTYGVEENGTEAEKLLIAIINGNSDYWCFGRMEIVKANENK